MKLVRKYKVKRDEFFCELTHELDKLCGFKDGIYRNYLLDVRDIWDNSFAIRVPGRTTGTIEIDSENRITECLISEELVGENCTYPEGTNEMLRQKFIGVIIEEEEINE